MLKFLHQKKHITDQELLLEFIETNQLESLGELYLRYYHLIYLVCQKYLNNSEDSKDAVFDIFIKIQKSVKNNDVKNFKNWLYVVSKNHCLMILRKKRINYVLTDTSELEKFSSDNKNLLYNENNKSEKELEFAFSKLNDNQRLCLELFYFLNKSYQDIANETGLSLKNIKSHIQNGKRNLKIFLTQNKRTDHE